MEIVKWTKSKVIVSEMVTAFCFQIGNQTKPSPPVVILTQPSSEDITMHKPVTAVCLISGFHPDKLSVKWLKDWQPIISGIVTSSSIKEDNMTFSTSSRLTVPAREWRSGVVYTCQVSHEPTQTIIVKNITKSSGRGHGTI
uniref:Ig-like domain-containing protein n=1 Tax=Callorhinchus milii TaxID=7868 RepID=A0A4W3ITK6_CALMI